MDIKQPCTENWREMTLTEQGAYCKSCSKEVIDFSALTDKEIVEYFERRKRGKICGRFKKDQLNRPLISIPPEVLTMNIPLWQKFIAVLFICFSGFLVGCGSKSPSYEDIPLPVVTVTPPTVNVTEKKNYIHLSEKDSGEAEQLITLGVITAMYKPQIKAPIIVEKTSARLKD